MKKLFSLICIIITLAFLTGCGESEEKKNSNLSSNTKAMVIENSNETGLAYDMTIEEFTEKFNDMYKEKTGKGIVADENEKMVSLDSSNWTVAGKKSQTDGKTTYTSYIYPFKKGEFVLAVDDNTEKIISVTTATTSKVWKSSAKEVEKIGTIASMVCAGYKLNKFNYMKKLYETSISGNCYFDNVIYKVIGTDSREDVIVKMISLPAEKKAIADTQYTDYVMYKQGKCDFGQHTEK